MPDDPITQTEEAYQKARAACRALQLDLYATPAQKEKAKAARDAMWVAYSEAILDDFTSRTALLQSLIKQLDNVISSIRENPVGDLLDQTNQTVSMVKTLLNNDDGTKQG